MVKKLIIFFMITICSFGISCCKFNISEVQNPFMPEKESDLDIPQKVIVPAHWRLIFYSLLLLLLRR